jgi:glucose-1-phosphate thymidylyltransferase
MKAIILAGGQGLRLYPQTKIINKHLISVYNKPMIYYPLSIAMLCKIKNIAIVCNEKDKKSFFDLLKDGSDLGIKISYYTQMKSDGIAGAIRTCEDFISNDKIMVLLGDNIFYGNNLIKLLTKNYDSHCTIFSYSTANYKNFGVIEYKKNMIYKIHEKPKKFYSSRIAVGLYIFKKNLINKINSIKKSKRQEFEITDVLNKYIQSNQCNEIKLKRGVTWFDTGTFDDLLKASNFIKIVEEEQLQKIGLIENIALSEGYISKKNYIKLIKKNKNSDYRKKLIESIGQ